MTHLRRWLHIYCDNVADLYTCLPHPADERYGKNVSWRIFLMLDSLSADRDFGNIHLLLSLIVGRFEYIMHEELLYHLRDKYWNNTFNT